MHNTRSMRWGARGLPLAAVVLLAVTGCGNDDTGKGSGAEPTASTTTTPTQGGSRSATPASPTPSNPDGQAALPEDWRPEEPTVLATGMKVPEDYEPATLEHPARNVPKPVMPPEAREETEAGAQAFLNYRADAQWYAMQTGDTSLVRTVTAPECKNCSKQFDEIESLYGEGGWAAGGWEPVKIIQNSFIIREDGGYNLPVSVDSKGSITFGPKVIKVRQEPYQGSELIDIYIDFKDGTWSHVTASPRGSL